MTKAFTLIAFAAAIGCTQVQLLHPELRSDWDQTLSAVRHDVDSGNYYAADKLIDEFVRTHSDTREAREIEFWKAAYALDPSNSSGSLETGIAGLDGYLAANPDGWYRNEAVVLRRTAAAAQGLVNTTRIAATTDTSPTPVVKDTVVVVSKSREEQIAALKDQLAQSKAELAKVSAELERIKKRLANPSN
jgi:hypothetical protein